MSNTMWPQFTEASQHNLTVCCMHCFVIEPRDIVQVTTFSKINQCIFSQLEVQVFPKYTNMNLLVLQNFLELN